jgi:hypothetical protein
MSCSCFLRILSIKDALSVDKRLIKNNGVIIKKTSHGEREIYMISNSLVKIPGKYYALDRWINRLSKISIYEII